MVYSSVSSMNIFHHTAGTGDVQKPKRRRKYVSHHMRSEESALKRNARERRRQGRINDALDRLNLHLPQTGTRDRKPGKEGIIRRAIDYIQTLSSILEQTSRKLPLFPIHGDPVGLPESSPEFQPLPAELFGQLMVEAQQWISSTQVTPLMTSSPNNLRIPTTDHLHSEYIIADQSPCTVQAVNVHSQSSGEESEYFDCSYDDIYSQSSSSGSSAADDIVDELFTSDSFTSEISNEYLESILDIDTFVCWWHTFVIILITISLAKLPILVALKCFESCTFLLFVCWFRIDVYFHLLSSFLLYIFNICIIITLFSCHQAGNMICSLF